MCRLVTFSRYQDLLGVPIGRGYQKEVWLVRHNETGRLFGIKRKVVLPAGIEKKFGPEKGLVGRFMVAAEREVLVAERLHAVGPDSVMRTCVFPSIPSQF
jgi:hypothetical protein